MRKRTKKKENDQQTENLKLFLNPGKGPKKWGNIPKKRGNRSTKWEFKTFFLNRKRTQQNGKRIKCKYSGNQPKIFGNPSTLFSFWGISDNSWKKKETDPNSLLGPIPCSGVSVLRRFHSSVQTGIEKVDPARKLKCTTAACDSDRHI